MISTLDRFSPENPRLVGYNDLGIGSHRKTPRPVRCNDHLIGSRRRIQGRSDTSITNNKHMINQQVSVENNYWKKTLPEHCRKMQKLAGDKQNRLATSKTCR
jgi:hypothetical protein